MNENSGYATFCLYHALHLHFTSSYDFIMYHGKVNISKDSFLNKKEKYTFYALSRKYNLDQAKNYFISNLFEKPKLWWGELNSPECEDVYKKWQKRNESLTYHFEQDIIFLFDNVKSINDLFAVNDGQDPILLKVMYHQDICIETFIILNHFIKFFDKWKDKISDDVIFLPFLDRCKKYEPFVEYDHDKIKKILVEKTKQYVKV
jgi:hypothetical protein